MRGNPRLVARHALSSSTQAQILTAATFTSGVQLKIDNVEEGERKIPATVQAALRNVISHHPSTAPRSKQLTRTQGCQTVPVEGVALSTTAVQTEYVNEEIKKVNELVEEVMDTRDEDMDKLSEVPEENIALSSPSSLHPSSPASLLPMSHAEHPPSPTVPTPSSFTQSQIQTHPPANPLSSLPQIPLSSSSPKFDISSPVPPTTTTTTNLQLSSAQKLCTTDTETPSSTSLPLPASSPQISSFSSTPVPSLFPEPPALLDTQASPSNQSLTQSSTESLPMEEECTELLSGMQGEKEVEDDKEILFNQSPFSVTSVSSPSFASTKEISPKKSHHSLSVSHQPSLPSLSPPPPLLSAPPLSSELIPEMEESEMMAAVASQLGLDALDSSLLNMADLISLLEPSAATSSVVQPPLPIEEAPLPPSIPPPPALSLLPLQDSTQNPPPHLSSPATSTSFSPSLPSLVSHHALPSPQQLQEAISFSPCDEPLAFDEQSLLRELPADLQETVQAILDGSTDTIQ